jgi:two-component system response regulator FixJ
MNGTSDMRPGGGMDGRQSEEIVYVIDDDSEVRRSLNFMLSSCGITSWPFSGGIDFFNQLPDLKPAPILLDIRMGRMNGLEVLAKLEVLGVKWPVVVMSGHGDISIAVRAMRLGAIEFLEKPFEMGALEASVALARESLQRAATDLARQGSAREYLSKLSARENEVLRALTDGAANKQVAHQLGLSTRTVEVYRASGLAKLKIRSIAEFVTLVGKAAEGNAA